MIKRKHIYLFLFIGFKLTSQEYLPKPEGEIIRHKYYTLSYNEDHEQANWVHYRLNPTFLNGTTPRINSFKVDPNVSTKSAELSDYKGSGYDRGHLAPAGDMKYSKESMIESFFMSNMSPQNPSFNRGIWRKLEEAIRRWGKKNEIYIALDYDMLQVLKKWDSPRAKKWKHWLNYIKLPAPTIRLSPELEFYPFFM